MINRYLLLAIIILGQFNLLMYRKGYRKEKRIIGIITAQTLQL